MTTFERIKELAKKQGKSLNRIEEELGYGKNVLYRLKNTNPSTERLQEIADYFGVSADYLLGREEKSSGKVQPPQDIMAFFRLNTDNLDTDDIDELEDELKDYAEFLIQKAIEKKKRRGN